LSGAFPFAKYDESRIQLQPKDLLVFYTDGVTEPENAYGEMFGEEKLTELLVRNAHLDEAQDRDRHYRRCPAMDWFRRVTG
jgi:sigma-B regulation protein RsbU (phosphoserine phosphatase)